APGACRTGGLIGSVRGSVVEGTVLEADHRDLLAVGGGEGVALDLAEGLERALGRGELEGDLLAGEELVQLVLGELVGRPPTLDLDLLALGLPQSADLVPALVLLRLRRH